LVIDIKTSWHVALLDANANNSAQAGTFAFNANNDSTNDNVNIGRQLCLKNKICNIITMPLGKTNNKISQVLVGHNDSKAPR